MGDAFSFLDCDVQDMEFNAPDLAMSKCSSKGKVMPFERKQEAKKNTNFEGISDMNYKNKQGFLTNSTGQVGLVNRSGNTLGFFGQGRKASKSIRVDRRSFKAPL